MDVHTGLVCVGVVVISAAVIILVSMFGMKEKSYEEAIAEQRRLPDDLLLGKKDKGKEKKHKNKAGKKVKEKKEEKDDNKEEKDEKSEHVQFEETPQILPPELPAQRDNLQHFSQSEPVTNKSPKDTPTKSKKNTKDSSKKKDEGANKEDKKDVNVNSSVSPPTNKEYGKETKDQQKETSVKEAKDPVKEVVKESAVVVQQPNKESRKKKKNDILAQIGGDKDAVNVSLLILFIKKAELSRSEIQILIDQLLNKQLDNPLEHSEWTEGRADPVIKLKKQLAEKEKALADEHEASIAFQNKLKELRAELNAERSRLSASVRQLEEALNNKITEAQTLHTRMQHILESHAAEKQGFARQIEQLQAKVNEDAAIIHKMQEDQGQKQGHMQELIAQRKQMEMQFNQMRDNENALKSQLAQKHVETQDLQNELQTTCNNSSAEIEILKQQLCMMQGQLIHSEGQLQHFKEASDQLQDVASQLEDSHRARADLDHRLNNAHRHEQELQKQIKVLQAELNVAKTEANDTSALSSELNKAQAELLKLQSEAAEMTTLKTELNNCRDELNAVHAELKNSVTEKKQLESKLNNVQRELDIIKSEYEKAIENHKQAQEQITKYQDELKNLQQELTESQTNLANAHAQIKATNETLANFTELQKEVKQLHEENESLASQLAATTERPAAEGRENGIEDKIQKNNVQLVEHANLLAQKENQLDALKTELARKEAEVSQLNAQVDELRSDMNNQHNFARRLQDDLEAQRIKNNELRTKNWKVMEALSAAESRAKSNFGENIDEVTQQIKVQQEDLTKAFLQRVFPEIKVSEKSHEQWINSFEKKIYTVLKELRAKNTTDVSSELEKQNKNLQGMVSHYKQIIDDTEGMLNILQNHIESEETRWQAQLHQKENEIANLRVELNDLRNKLSTNETLQQEISELESRLADEKCVKEQAISELNIIEKLQEEKTRLSEELQIESSRRAALDAEVIKLRSFIETNKSSPIQEKKFEHEICGGCSSTEQSVLNGPPSSASPQSEDGSEKK